VRGLSKHDAALLVVSLIWGANYSITKQALAYVSPLTFAALRFSLSTGLLWLLVWWFRQYGPCRDRWSSS
jgi:drug/metabolite transporter (DMT)-like permease